MHVAVLSPHRDDAAFSCGLTLQAMMAAGSTLTIVNVFTVSRYAPYFAGGIGDLTQRVTELRRHEDAAFVEVLRRGVGVECGEVELVDLGWRDVPVRWEMEDKKALAPMKLRTEEVQDLARMFGELPRYDLVFAPMALGGHLDHRLVLEAARQALPAVSLVFYEDLPYGCRMQVAACASEEFEALPEEWLPGHGAAGGSKREYALCYPSQIAKEVAEEMESYASKHGGRERFAAGAEAMQRLRALLQQDGVVIA